MVHGHQHLHFPHALLLHLGSIVLGINGAAAWAHVHPHNITTAEGMAFAILRLLTPEMLLFGVADLPLPMLVLSLEYCTFIANRLVRRRTFAARFESAVQCSVS